ncbi:SAM-dependent methyltransferase [Spirillospora sp. NPDC047279]|uniref:SAM-dependent methyltransferase n=1 Tax=Spirillospora sp. NPDC047279 TaxID=3155478 RepID=UPI0033C1119B
MTNGGDGQNPRGARWVESDAYEIAWRDVEPAVELISAPWVLKVVQALIGGPLDHGELVKATGLDVGRVDQALGRLAAAGGVDQEYGDAELARYRLTRHGRELLIVLADLGHWWERGRLERERQDAARLGVDVQTPSVARIWDAMIGGKDNYAVDRAAVERLLEIEPHSATFAKENRKFLALIVERLIEAGVRQFIDIGTGLPTMENVHQIAHRLDPETRVVYVDNDPAVCAHARALLTENPATVTVLQEDLRRPTAILAHPATRRMIDFTRPVGVLTTGILHFVPDHDDPARALKVLTDAMPSGSYLALTHLTDDTVKKSRPEDAQAGLAVFDRSNAPLRLRSRAEIETFLEGLELIEPGLACLTDWGLDTPTEIQLKLRNVWLGAAGRKP